jgi:hypothetical protein
MHSSRTYKTILALLRLFGKDMAVIGLPSLQFTAARKRKTLLGTAIWLHFRHIRLFTPFLTGRQR